MPTATSVENYSPIELWFNCFYQCVGVFVQSEMASPFWLPSWCQVDNQVQPSLEVEFRVQVVVQVDV